MALNVLRFQFRPDSPVGIDVERSHTGVTGSGDLEILMEKRDLGGNVEFKITTPVVGFDDVWEKVLDRFISESGLANVAIEINDDNATPIVVYTRLCQALEETRREGVAGDGVV